MNDFDGILPETAAELEKQLPGVGRYTAGNVSSVYNLIRSLTHAGAIASIAYNEVASVVRRCPCQQIDGIVESKQLDGNVHRVLTRQLALHADQNAKATTHFLWNRADEMVDPDRPGDFNQAMMELGASVCTYRTPLCGQCPVSGTCKAFAEVRSWIHSIWLSG